MLRAYLPLMTVGAVIVAMVALAPSEVPDSGVSAAVPNPEDIEEGVTATGWGDTVQACDDRSRQIDSGYSPPCFSFSGDNGGATAPGVTEDSIVVSYRSLTDGHLLETLGLLAGQPLGESPEDLARTVDGLVDYFNQNFEMYGRQIQLEHFDGQGLLTDELLGAGQDDANVDGQRASDIGAFADLSGLTQPYAEALARQEIVSVGAPYMSRQWFREHAPYAWSTFPDCTYVAEVSAEIGIERVLDERAILAGGDLANRDRKLGIIYPNNEEYVRCGERSVEMLREAGYEPVVQNYNLKLDETDANATSMLARLRSEGVTSVACGCDPLMMRALTIEAEQNQYYPEWFMLGVGFIDLDLVGQIVASGSGDQWTRVFGGSPSVAPVEFGQSEGYQAFKSVRPSEEPSIMIDWLYGMVYRLAIGIQMAGPELTPQNFAAGMYNYPGGSGELGAWRFTPDNMPGVVDARFVFWLPDEPSPFNGQPGTYGDTGERFTDPSDAPSQDELIGMLGELQ